MAKFSTNKILPANGMVYPILGVASCIAYIYLLSSGDSWVNFYSYQSESGFVVRNGTHLMVDGKEFYAHGFNSYWLIDMAVVDYTRHRTKAILEIGSKMGLTVCRTWGFNDGTYHAIQISPGRYNEQVLKAYDYVIAEAGRNGIKMLFSLVNNLYSYGGKGMYVKWAWEEGIGLSSSNDSFFFDPTTRRYFKNYVKTVLTRKNTITGIQYKDDPNIFAWELINEPRCPSDVSGDILQAWIEEMSSFVKSIDKNHLVTVGLEGFYGPKSPKRLTVNPGEWATASGTDFVRNSQISTIDFASAHVYPDNWFNNKDVEFQLEFVSKWMNSHIEDAERELKKPIMFTEFGYAKTNKDFEPSHRDRFYKTVFDIVYKTAKEKGACAGSVVWQFFVGGFDEFNDEYGIIPWERPATYDVITSHSCRLAKIQGVFDFQKKRLTVLCSKKIVNFSSLR